VSFSDLNLVSRALTLQGGETQKVFSVNTQPNQGWQFVYQFSRDTENGTIEITSSTNIAQFNQIIDFGGGTGDFIVGKGAVEIQCTNLGAVPATLNAYLTTENFIDEVQSLTEVSQSGGAIGVFVDVGTFTGHCPYPYNRFSIFTSNNLDLRFVDSGGGAVATYLNLGNTNRFVLNQPMPKRLRLQFAGTVANQPFTVKWGR